MDEVVGAARSYATDTRPITMADLAEFPFVGLRSDAVTRGGWDALFERAGAPVPQPVVEVTTPEAMLECVHA